MTVANDFELLGARHGLRSRDLVRARSEEAGAVHPDFVSDEPRLQVDPDVVPVDAATDFASVGRIVDRMRAAFFRDRS